MVLLINWFLFLAFGSFLSAFVLDVNGVVFDEQDFYSKYSKGEWDRSTDKQRESILKDYIKRESCSLDAFNNGFSYDPFVGEKINSAKKKLLVNFAYETFVAQPLVDSLFFDAGLKNLKTEVFLNHVLISFSGSSLSSPPFRDQGVAEGLAFLLADSLKNNPSLFSSFAKNYSDDPSVLRNSGSLGWVRWGQAPPLFQLSAWALDLGAPSFPVLTDFGYHIILKDSARSSEFVDYDSSSYRRIVLQASFSSVKDSLRFASESYDSLVVQTHGVLFYGDELSWLYGLYEKQKGGGVGSAPLKSFNFPSFLRELDRFSLICSFDGEDFGLLWFFSQIKNIPPSRIPVFKNPGDLRSFFMSFVLRELATRRAFDVDLDSRLFFKKRLEVERNKILYDSYLKFLVNSVSVDSSSVKRYFLMNRDEKYFDPEKVLVRQIRLVSRSFADSLWVLLGEEPFRFEGFAAKHSISRGAQAGLMDPFERGKYNELGDVAFGLSLNELAGPIQNLDKTFSIIRLEGRVSKKHQDLSRVYKKIESLLLKEGQEKIKKTTFDGYLNNKNLKLGGEYKKYYN